MVVKYFDEHPGNINTAFNCLKKLENISREFTCQGQMKIKMEKGGIWGAKPINCSLSMRNINSTMSYFIMHFNI